MDNKRKKDNKFVVFLCFLTMGTGLGVGILAFIESITGQDVGTHFTRAPSTIYDSDGALLQGVIGSPPPAGSGVAFLYSDDGVFDTQDGGILLDESGMLLTGSSVHINKLKGVDQRDVQVDEFGELLAIDLPPPNWELSDTDTGDYDLGTGVGVGPWVEMTGLIVTTTDAIAPADRTDITVRIFAVNKTGNRSGTIELDVGVDGADPLAAGDLHVIPPGFSGYLTSATNFTGVTVNIGQTISVFGRRTFGDNNAFGVDLEGTPNQHSLDVYSSPAVQSAAAQVAAGIASQDFDALALIQAIYNLFPFGGIRAESNVTAEATVDVTPRQILAWNIDGLSNGTTVDHTDDAVKAITPGNYEAFASLSFSGSPVKTYMIEIYTFDDSASTWNASGIRSERLLGAGGDVGCASLGGFVTLDVDDKVGLFQSTDGSVLTVTEAQLNMRKLND